MKLPALMLLAAACCALPARAEPIHVVTETSNRTMVADGKVSGPLTETVEMTLRAAGIDDYHIDVFPWARTYQVALREPNTLIYPLARTPEREQHFKWVGQMQRIQYHLVKLASRKDISIKRLEDAKAYSIGVVRDDVRHQYLLSHGFTKLVVVAKWNDNLARLINNQIDLLTLADFDLAPVCAEMAVNCDGIERTYALDELSTGLYMAFSKSTPDALVARTRAAFDKLKAEGKIDRVMKANR